MLASQPRSQSPHYSVNLCPVRKLKDPHILRGDGTAHKLRPSLSPLCYTFRISPFSSLRSALPPLFHVLFPPAYSVALIRPFSPSSVHPANPSVRLLTVLQAFHSLQRTTMSCYSDSSSNFSHTNPISGNSDSETSDRDSANSDFNDSASVSSASISSGSVKSWASKLGKDGKLSTVRERQRCFDYDLCLYRDCGGTGHKVKNCPKPQARTRYARVTSISDVFDSNSDSDSNSESSSRFGNWKVRHSVRRSCAAAKPVRR